MKKNVMKLKAMPAKLFAMMITVLVLPAISYCQPPDPADGNPDVPFADNMNIVFLIIGVAFAAMIVWQEIKTRRKLQG